MVSKSASRIQDRIRLSPPGGLQLFRAAKPLQMVILTRAPEFGLIMPNLKNICGICSYGLDQNSSKAQDYGHEQSTAKTMLT